MTSTNTERTHPTLILAVLSLAGVAYAMLSSSVVPALPTIQRALHTSETDITWLLTGYLLSASVGTAIIGRLGDMYGKERLLLWTLVVLAGGTLLAAVSSSLACWSSPASSRARAAGSFRSRSESSATSSPARRSLAASACCRRSWAWARAWGSCSQA